MASMRHWPIASAALLTLGLAFAAPRAPARAATLDDIRARKTVRIGVRADAPPFSFTDAKGVPGGYMVELCKAVVNQLAD